MKLNESNYNIYEASGVVEPMVIFSNPSSTEITVQVYAMDVTAMGKLYAV